MRLRTPRRLPRCPPVQSRRLSRLATPRRGSPPSCAPGVLCAPPRLWPRRWECLRRTRRQFPDTTQDADLFAEKTGTNGRAIVAALGELGFALSANDAAEIERGKDFVQLKNGPFDLDLVFAPDGIETFADAWRRRVEVEGFPVCHLADIIASKTASNRVKDRESLPRLLAFREYWLQRQ